MPIGSQVFRADGFNNKIPACLPSLDESADRLNKFKKYKPESKKKPGNYPRPET